MMMVTYLQGIPTGQRGDRIAVTANGEGVTFVCGGALPGARSWSFHLPLGYVLAFEVREVMAEQEPVLPDLLAKLFRQRQPAGPPLSDDLGQLRLLVQMPDRQQMVVLEGAMADMRVLHRELTGAKRMASPRPGFGF